MRRPAVRHRPRFTRRRVEGGSTSESYPQSLTVGNQAIPAYRRGSQPTTQPAERSSVSTRPHEERSFYDLTVVGGSPGGNAVALLGAAAGLSVALVERRPSPGTGAALGRLATLGLVETARVARTIARASEFGVLTKLA